MGFLTYIPFVFPPLNSQISQDLSLPAPEGVKMRELGTRLLNSLSEESMKLGGWLPVAHGDCPLSYF